MKEMVQVYSRSRIVNCKVFFRKRCGFYQNSILSKFFKSQFLSTSSQAFGLIKLFELFLVNINDHSVRDITIKAFYWSARSLIKELACGKLHLCFFLGAQLQWQIRFQSNLMKEIRLTLHWLAIPRPYVRISNLTLFF